MIPKFIYYWTIQGYEKSNEKLELFDVSIVQVDAETSEEALEKAKRILAKSFYRIASVVEHANPLAEIGELNRQTMRDLKSLNEPPRKPWMKKDEEDNN